MKTAFKPVWQSESGSRVLAFFCRHAGVSFYAKEIAEWTHLSAGAVNIACRRIAGEGFVTRQKRGREFFYSFNYSHAPARAYKVFVTVADLQPILSSLFPLCRRILMYGSASKGEDGPKSDVDILAESDNPQAEKAVQSVMSENARYSIKLKTPAEMLVLRKKDPAFYENAVLRGLTVYENV